MINSIYVSDFFSFSGDTSKIHLNNKNNILLGINGTGKSNFIKALAFLYESVIGHGLEKTLNKWGGFTNVVNLTFGNTALFTIRYEFDKAVITSLLNGKGYAFPTNPIYQITIQNIGNSSYSITEHIYCENISNHSLIISYLHTGNGRGRLYKKTNDTVEIKTAFFKSEELVLRQISDPNEYFPLYTLKKAIEEIVVYHYFDTTPNSLIRQLSPFYSEQKLLPNGENLTHLLNYLNGNNSNAYDKIIHLLRTALNSNFKDLVFVQPTPGKTLLALKEHNLNRAVPVEHISDGTLRFLLLLSIFYNPNRGKLICIDEPEIGLHPDMIRTIAEGIKYAAQNGTQMIIATHSPLLLNAFDLEDILIFEKDNNNFTIISRKSEEDCKDMEGELLVGQMWLNGQIGGVRW
jgi:predicted ATPase